MRTKEKQREDAIYLLKKLNKYTGSGLYMLKHGSDDKDDGLMLKLAQDMIRGIQTMATVEVCKMDEDDCEEEPNALSDNMSEDESSIRTDNISDRDVIRYNYMQSHRPPNKTDFEIDCQILEYLNGRLKGNEKEGLSISQEEFWRAFPYMCINDIQDSLIRLVYGLYVDDMCVSISAVNGYLSVKDENVWKANIYYTDAMPVDEFKKSAKNKNFHGVTIW